MITLLVREFQMAVRAFDHHIAVLLAPSDVMQLKAEWVGLATASAPRVSSTQALVLLFESVVVIQVFLAHCSDS